MFILIQLFEMHVAGEGLKAKSCGSFTREPYGSLRCLSALLCERFKAQTLLTAVKNEVFD